MSGERESLHNLFLQVLRYHFIRYHHLLGRIGLHQGQPLVLALLWEKDGRTQGEIAEALRLRPATVTVVLRRMEKAGLLRRENDPKDLRVVRVYLTKQGKSLKRKVRTIHSTLEKECFAHFTPEEKALLQEFFIRMRENLRKVTEEANNP
ncbi:MAG: MarR family transcriptional regulator [Candidatus Caldatribacterium sp.]|uniref:MarR family winged helix-turn-helix transcriptional regulator n=1 Tax=Candidatus Caldatribacterium sp. TaxID=2282143 RepID=UPI00299B110E|nr:MarR family transcriptional regulator [Candidatus Caldatribacterium sp.]MCX7731155.1 MarR family transcriptional regulator [Candidatus Caldatribacterium sp.]MDW8080947.1 MarR family transcriptional regulator [Candidatus Calescibacterium sp.]